MKNLRDHIHSELNQEIMSIGGSYVLTKEICLPFHNREVLYLVGYGVFDNTWCGSGGYAYALVPGFIINWKKRKNKEGLPLSQVESIRDQNVKAKIQCLIEEKEVVQQVIFE